MNHILEVSCSILLVSSKLLRFLGYKLAWILHCWNGLCNPQWALVGSPSSVTRDIKTLICTSSSSRAKNFSWSFKCCVNWVLLAWSLLMDLGLLALYHTLCLVTWILRCISLIPICLLNWFDYLVASLAPLHTSWTGPITSISSTLISS
jgi:hypothetical protein